MKKSAPKSKPIKKKQKGNKFSVGALKQIILKNDLRVKMSKGKMMGEEGLLFHEGNDFKYAITSSPERITLHSLPMYCNQEIHRKYKPLFIGSSFGKGCIRFKPNVDMNTDLLASFVKDCSASLS
jgi:hypothetical protein